MAAGIGVGCRMTLRRPIATADVSALQADSQLAPQRSSFQAILATGHAFRKFGHLDVCSMRALVESRVTMPGNMNVHITRTCVAYIVAGSRLKVVNSGQPSQLDS